MTQEYRIHPWRTLRLYPWELRQLRLSHSSPVPFPEAALGAVPLQGFTSPSGKTIQTIMELLADHLEAWPPFQYKIAAYVTIELAEETFSAWPNLVAQEAAELITKELDLLHQAAHGELDQSPELNRRIIEGWWQVIREFGDNGLDNEENLMTAAYRAALIVLLDVGGLADHRNQLQAALWRMWLGVEGEFGREAAEDLMRVWWNRVFSRLAFVQPPDDED